MEYLHSKEGVAEFARPMVMQSTGKDLGVMLRLA